MKQFKLRIRYTGGDADQNRLDLYDGTQSIHGFAQTIQIATHALINGQIVSRATALKNSHFYVTGTKKGSLVFEIVAVIEKYPALATLAAPAFYDFLKYCFKNACGVLDSKPQHSTIRKQFERKEPFIDQLSETLEGSLQRAHKPLQNGVTEITLESTSEKIMTFNKETLDWVTSREISEVVADTIGNVTRYNAVSSNGRAYIRSEEKILPFRLSADFPESKKTLITWSLHKYNNGVKDNLEFYFQSVESARGTTKRIILVDCATRNDLI